jgi:hypothetical protein
MARDQKFRTPDPITINLLLTGDRSQTEIAVILIKRNDLSRRTECIRSGLVFIGGMTFLQSSC